MFKNFNFSKKTKLFAIIFACIILVGVVLFSTIGFNQTIDYSNHYEVRVEFNYATTESTKIADTEIRNYLNGKGFSISAEENVGDGQVLIYKTYKNKTLTSEEITELKTKVSEALLKASISTGTINTVGFKEVTPFNEVPFGKICIALGIAVVAIFVLLFFIEKVAAALATIISSLLSGLLFASVMAIIRVPGNPFIWTSICLAVILGSILSAGMLARFRENLKNVANDGLTMKEIAEKSLQDSLPRYFVSLCCVVVVSLILICVGPNYLRLAGAQLLIAGICSTLTSLIWTPFFWSIFKKRKKGYSKEKVETKEVTDKN